MDIGCALLCAGTSERFRSGNKLLYSINGVTLIESALRCVSVHHLFSDTVAIASCNDVSKICLNSGVRVIMNNAPELTISESVRLAVSELQHMDAIMFLVADQPKLTPKTVAGCVGYYLNNPNCIVSAGTNKRYGNPNIFPKTLFSELSSLPDGYGGSYCIKKHKNILRVFIVDDEHELYDIDTFEDLSLLNEFYS